MIETPLPRVVEAGIAALVAALVVGVIAWRTDADVIVAGAVAFLAVFLGLLWRHRTSTIHHRSNSARSRTRR